MIYIVYIWIPHIDFNTRNIIINAHINCLNKNSWQFDNNNAEMSSAVKAINLTKKTFTDWASFEWQKKMFFNRLSTFALKTQQVAGIEVSVLFFYSREFHIKKTSAKIDFAKFDISHNLNIRSFNKSVRNGPMLGWSETICAANWWKMRI